MHQPTLHDQVRLTHAIPTLWLQRGDVGVVESIWHSSSDYCEVEFHERGESLRVRALVAVDDLEVIGAATGAGVRRKKGMSK
jgi:hypothetical protein